MRFVRMTAARRPWLAASLMAALVLPIAVFSFTLLGE
jgi:hypothetical protein